MAFYKVIDFSRYFTFIGVGAKHPDKKGNVETWRCQRCKESNPRAPRTVKFLPTHKKTSFVCALPVPSPNSNSTNSREYKLFTCKQLEQERLQATRGTFNWQHWSGGEREGWSSTAPAQGGSRALPATPARAAPQTPSSEALGTHPITEGSGTQTGKNAQRWTLCKGSCHQLVTRCRGSCYPAQRELEVSQERKGPRPWIAAVSNLLYCRRAQVVPYLTS